MRNTSPGGGAGRLIPRRGARSKLLYACPNLLAKRGARGKIVFRSRHVVLRRCSFTIRRELLIVRGRRTVRTRLLFVRKWRDSKRDTYGGIVQLRAKASSFAALLNRRAVRKRRCGYFDRSAAAGFVFPPLAPTNATRIRHSDYIIAAAKRVISFPNL